MKSNRNFSFIVSIFLGFILVFNSEFHSPVYKPIIVYKKGSLKEKLWFYFDVHSVCFLMIFAGIPPTLYYQHILETTAPAHNRIFANGYTG